MLKITNKGGENKTLGQQNRYNMSGNRAILCDRVRSRYSAVRVTSFAVLSLHPGFRGNELLMRNASRAPGIFSTFIFAFWCRAPSYERAAYIRPAMSFNVVN